MRSHRAPLPLGGFNECDGAFANDTQGLSTIEISDTVTGETGYQYFEDETCTEFDYEEVVFPSCISGGTSTSSYGEDCSDNCGLFSHYVIECTEDGENVKHQ